MNKCFVSTQKPLGKVWNISCTTSRTQSSIENSLLFIVSEIAEADSIACALSLTSFLQFKCDNALSNFEHCGAWPFCESVWPTSERGIFKTPRNQDLLHVVSISGVYCERRAVLQRCKSKIRQGQLKKHSYYRNFTRKLMRNRLRGREPPHASDSGLYA